MTNKREQFVIDGLERINVIHKLLSEEEWKLSKLDDIDPIISGKTNLKFQNEYPDFSQFIENFPIPVHIIRCDFQKQEHIDFISLIYQRLR
ncbi:hypothetical protein KY334_07415 [Candidatus Woesearchaeota archaeon]|nr:hypothetical protein [Candidatus Woesearchaeota archaeon]